MKRTRSFRIALPVALGVAIFLSDLPDAEAGENIWTTNGPPSPVQHLASSPSDPSTIYAAGYSDLTVGSLIFKSVNGGETWTRLAVDGIRYGEVTCLLVDPRRPANVYAGRYKYMEGSARPAIGHFLRSQDGGAKWQIQVLNGAPFPSAIAADDATGAIYLAAATWNSRLLKSTNGGQSWNETALDASRVGYALLADSLRETVLVGTNFDWMPTQMGLYPSGGNIARTADGGTNWSLSPIDLGSPVISLARNAQSSAYYAGTEAGALYRSTDGGSNWHSLTTVPGAGAISALVVDPSEASILYAATQNRGLFRSTNGGDAWYSFNAGMPSRHATSLVIDPSGRVLHVGTDLGVFDRDIARVAAPDSCLPGAEHLCFLGSRFRVDLTAIDPFTRKPFAAHALPADGRSGYFTFPSLTGDSTFPEVMVRMVDATSLPGQDYWISYSGMTDVLYTMTITDTATGVSREYSGENSCGGTDATRFLPAAAAAQAVVARTPPGALPAVRSELSLLNGRFRVILTARHPTTAADVPGLAIPQADRYGAFSLPEMTGDPSRPEVFVKMVDAGGGSFLFFYSGVTHVDYAIKVFDSVTETEETYVSENADARRPCGASRLLTLPR